MFGHNLNHLHLLSTIQIETIKSESSKSTLIRNLRWKLNIPKDQSRTQKSERSALPSVEKKMKINLQNKTTT